MEEEKKKEPLKEAILKGKEILTKGKEALTKEKNSEKKISQNKIIFVAISAVVLALLGLLIFKSTPSNSKKNILNIDQAKEKAANFINENLMVPGTKATIDKVEKEYGLYKMTVNLGEGEPIESFISQDGELFFPQAIDLSEYEENQNGSGVEASIVTNKNDKPEIELFAMSHCTYGNQMEKGLIPVLELLKDKINFNLKFASYAMHDKVELDEQLNQYCIQKEEGEKLLNYLKCFTASGDTAKCLKESGVNIGKISTCVKATDKEYKITESFNDKTTWLSETYPIFPIFDADNEKYGVQGSPTLIINGEIVSSERDSNSLLQLVCTAFNSAPDECQQELSNTVPGYGFGE